MQLLFKPAIVAPPCDIVSGTVKTRAGTHLRYVLDSAQPTFPGDMGLSSHKFRVPNVSQALTLPDFRPVANQRWRWALEPWVNFSGTTAPPRAP